MTIPQLERFPERDERAVRWFTVNDARDVIRNRRLRELIARVSAVLVSVRSLSELFVYRELARPHAAARLTGRGMEERS